VVTRDEALLVVISGPSGAGKSSLANGLVGRDASYRMSISATTRPPRGGEAEGREYFFLSPEEFLRRKERQEFAEWAVVHNHYYGTPRHFVDETLSSGRSVVFDIDVQGSMQIRTLYPGAVLIFVVPPSLAVLRERLEGRRTDVAEVIETRMANALRELTYIDRFDYLLVNDRLDRAHADLDTVLRAERMRVARAKWQGLVGHER
jgi:guanylate kinase